MYKVESRLNKRWPLLSRVVCTKSLSVKSCYTWDECRVCLLTRSTSIVALGGRFRTGLGRYALALHKVYSRVQIAQDIAALTAAGIRAHVLSLNPAAWLGG